MSILRDDIHRLVEVFYQPTFKTFYVNSIDGETFTKPIGVFVSLGITTSDKMLEDIKDVLADKYNAVIAEISSVKKSGVFLNTLINTQNPEKYLIEEYDDTILNEEVARKELDQIKSLMTTDQTLAVLQENAAKISKLQELIGKLDSSPEDGWKYHYIQKDNGTYKLFHRYINYKKEDEIEYRIGIYVSEKS